MTLRIEQTAPHINPFNIINCPLCEGTKFVSIDHASVFCEECEAKFCVRPTAGDEGFVVDCFPEYAWESKVKRPEILADRLKPYRIFKTGDDDSGWIASKEDVGLIHITQRTKAQSNEIPNDLITKMIAEAMVENMPIGTYTVYCCTCKKFSYIRRLSYIREDSNLEVCPKCKQERTMIWADDI